MLARQRRSRKSLPYDRSRRERLAYPTVSVGENSDPELAFAVVAPAVDAAVGEERARMTLAGADGDRVLDARDVDGRGLVRGGAVSQLAATVRAPRCERAVGQDREHVPLAGDDR